MVQYAQYDLSGLHAHSALDQLMSLSRRHFIHRAGALSLGFTGLQRVLAAEDAPPLLNRTAPGYGPLLYTTGAIVSLPEGFTAQPISSIGERMNDGLMVPGKHDGMGAMPGPDGLTILIRNHEISPGHGTTGPFDPDNQGLRRVDVSRIYDRGAEDGPFAGPSRGSTTTLVFDTRRGREPGQLMHHALSLTGTEHNCAGGITPGNTWISCEESVIGPGDELGRTQKHGYCFEVPASVTPSLVKPEPIIPMGRFNHEAVAVDPHTGIVYMTEDRNDGAIYRFIPKVPGKYMEGGRLQIMALQESSIQDLRNWDETPQAIPGRQLRTRWLDLDDIDSDDDSLRYQAFDRGGIRFARGEGMWYGNNGVYFACTTGGTTRRGQIWKYVPAAPEIEGAGEQAEGGGQLELFIEPNDASVVEHADNLTVAPWGDLIVCEDGLEQQFLLGVTPKGDVYKLAGNQLNQSEFAGATFSPDGSTLFVNIQNPGMTLAITGPWNRIRT